MLNDLFTHLWQSTLFVFCAWLLTVALRGNRAKVRFSVWLAASLKFFIPFAFLIHLGSQIQWTPAAHQIATQYAMPAVAFAVQSVAEPFRAVSQPLPSAPQQSGAWAFTAFLGLWSAGVFAIAAIRVRLWLRIRRILRASTLMEIPAPVEVRSASGLLEPGVVGIWKPILLLPEGIANRLTSIELETVLAHELCHVRRRNNLFAAIHMIVEAVFWFYPLVWWIGARMVEERERACDENVLSLGNEPRIYADAILGVCRLYAESPLLCVSGVTGSNIRRRIEAIMTNRGSRTLSPGRKVLLTAAGALALGGPVVVGVLISCGQLPEIHAQSPIVLPVSVPASSQIAPPPAPATPALAAPVQNAGQPITPFQDRRLIVMLFDLTGTTADQQNRAKTSAAGYIANEKQSADVVSVMSVSSGKVEVLRDFTADPMELNATIQNIKGNSEGAPATDGLSQIESVAKMVRAFPQKKALVLFADWGTNSDNPAALRQAIDAAHEANMAIFPVDISAGGPGRAMASPAPPAGVSPVEYARRVAYAQSRFGAKSPMAASYARYGAPDQIEDRSGSQVWRYKFLDDYQGGAAFEFSRGSFPGARILYPQPQATFEGNAASTAQLAQLIGGFRRGADASAIQAGFPDRRVSIQIYPAAPGVAPAPDRRFVPVLIPLSALSGTVEIIGQIRRLDNRGESSVVAQVADNVQAPSATYQTAFTLRPGAYVCKVLVRETSTGRRFGEVANFEVK